MEIWQLHELKQQGYQVLYRQNTKVYFIPLKDSYESLLENINDTVLWEDDIVFKDITITDSGTVLCKSWNAQFAPFEIGFEDIF